MKNTSLSSKDYLERIKTGFTKQGDPEIAIGQSKYMRDQFQFIGVKMPIWRAIAREFFKEHGGFLDERLCGFVKQCYAEEYRELQYFGNEMLTRGLKKQEKEFIDCFEHLITTRSWWDTVDILSKQVGIHFMRFPELQHPISRAWMDSGHIWLQRIAIIHQLHLKEKTDVDLLFEMILRVSDSKEFFLQKGAGWALRQHSKLQPLLIRDFIESHDLPALTKREGMKWLKKQE